MESFFVSLANGSPHIGRPGKPGKFESFLFRVDVFDYSGLFVFFSGAVLSVHCS